MMNGLPISVVEIEAYDPALGGTRMLYFASTGFVTRPSETPSNTFFDERVTQALDVSRSMCGGGRTIGRGGNASIGDLTLANGDGALDFMNELAFDNRTLTVRRSVTDRPVYPTDFQTIYVGTMDTVLVQSRDVRVRVRDRERLLDAPLQPNRYAGSNVLPDGLEGVPEDLGGKPKPICFGVVKSVPAPCVNTSKLIYQVNDGAVASVDGVYDRGLGLTPATKWLTPGQIANKTFSTLFYGGGLWVAATQSGEIYTSPDGISWTLQATFGSDAMRCGAYGNSTWVVVGALHSYTSTDGVSWSTQSTPTATGLAAEHQAAHFMSGPNLFICVSNSGDINTSPDGATWTSRVAGSGGASGSNGLFSLTSGNGIAVVAGLGRILSSYDCVTWTQRATLVQPSTVAITSLAFGVDRFVGTGTGAGVFSLDGITWTRFNTGFPRVVAYAGKFIGYGSLIGAPSGALSSLDGQTWVESNAPWSGHAPFRLATDGFTVVGVNQDGTLSYTTSNVYASLADLEDDNLAPMIGEYAVYAGGGYFRLGSTPDGIVTADVTEGASASDRTPGGIAYRLMIRAGIDPSMLNLSDFEDLGYVP